MSEKLAVGKIVTTHGLKGEVKVKSFSDETEHFKGMEAVEIRGEVGVFIKKVESVKMTGKAVILKLEGTDTITEAEKISGALIWVNRKYCAPLRDGEYYAADLCGCTISCRGKIVGTVIHVVSGVQADFLEVEKTDGVYRLLPCMDVYIKDIDLEEMTIDLREDWIIQ